MTANLITASANIIRLLCRNFTLTPVIIFAFFTEYVTICIQNIAYKLKVFSTKEKKTEMTSAERKKGILIHLKICNNLLGLRDEIKSRFEWMLIANCFQAAVMIITSSYYTIESIFDGYLAHVIWNSVDTAQFFFRVWLICYMADRLRQSVSNFTNSYFID